MLNFILSSSFFISLQRIAHAVSMKPGVPESVDLADIQPRLKNLGVRKVKGIGQVGHAKVGLRKKVLTTNQANVLCSHFEGLFHATDVEKKYSLDSHSSIFLWTLGMLNLALGRLYSAAELDEISKLVLGGPFIARTSARSPFIGRFSRRYLIERLSMQLAVMLLDRPGLLRKLNLERETAPFADRPLNLRHLYPCEET